MVGCFCCWLPFAAFPIWIITFQKFTEVSIMKKNLTELVFVLDRSGSMSGLEKDTIGGFNSMLGRQKERYGWEFLFLGANIDAIETAGRFGIQPSRAVNYECDSAGTQLNFQVVSDTVCAARACTCDLSEYFDDPAWKKAIEKDYSRRGRQRRHRG